MAVARPVSRAAAPVAIAVPQLGPLEDLPGTWIGTGFNLIARPDFKNKKPFFLQVSGTIEHLEFARIGGDIPNRGSEQGDISLHGVHYLQKVADCLTHGALHIEPGLWLFVPATTDPNVPVPTVVRHATIPHGDSLLAQSTLLKTVNTGPQIDPVDSFPFTDATIPDLTTPASHIFGAPYINPYLDNEALSKQVSESCLPQGMDLVSVVRNPALVLQAAIKGQTILRTVVIAISTAAVPGSTGILNIPFVVRNANALQMDAIFWIETVKPIAGDPFLQLQYLQRVILDFPDTPNGSIIHWPHMSVATLVKQ
jgi:hypothetical protein